MGFKVSSLWAYPEINPINRKAKTIPVLNPFTNPYGRVFFCAWFGFFIAFWSWYAFPPLLALTIAKDIGASKAAQQNSNIVGLCSTLLVRLISGPLCDRFGPRNVFAAILLIGALPTFCAGGIYNETGLIALRFFLGLIGGSFVPCQVWSTGFFDKSVVGAANALTAGFGNAGGGVTFFLMPQIFDSLVQRGLSSHNAWRVAFVVPGILIVFMAIITLTCCPETPTGSWADRDAPIQQISADATPSPAVVNIHGDINEKATMNSDGTSSRRSEPEDTKEKHSKPNSITADHEAQMDSQGAMIDIAHGEIVQKPTLKEALHVILSLPTLTLAVAYLCTFGTELAVNGILGNYYSAAFPYLGQTGTGNWAAMFGLLNVVFRPAGGLVSDFMYRRTHNLWLRKAWLIFLGIMTGAFLMAIGFTNPHSQNTMFGLIAGLAFFLEAANGANFSLVPHVHPHANGIVSGVTGASGNLGGICFAIVFRYMGTTTTAQFAKGFWTIGVIVVGLNLLICWIRPVPKGQIGGR